MSSLMALALYALTFPLEAVHTVRCWVRRTAGLPARGWF